MKKKIIALALAAVLLIGGIIGGAFAYLTDESDVVENVFVLGDIDITMHELMRDKEEPSKLVAFEQNQVLLPGYENMAWEPYYWGQATLDFEGAWTQGTEDDPDAGDLPYTCWNDLFNADTYGVMDKFLFVENTGKTDAYFRTVIAIESPEGLTEGAIHYNISSYTGYDWNQNTAEVETGKDEIEVIEGVEINGVRYDIIVANYVNVLTPGEVARPSFLQVGLDAKANNEDMELLGEELTVLVATQAVQVYGFEENALAALEAGFGKVTADNHPFKPVWDGTADTAWYNDTETDFVLDTAEELAGLAQLVNGGNTFAGKTIILGADMDLGNKEWTPIGTELADGTITVFRGTLDGAGYTIKNLQVTGAATITGSDEGQHYLGLFGSVSGSGAAIKNLNVEEVVINGVAGYNAAIAGHIYNGAVVENCTVKNAAITGADKTGAIVGFTANDAAAVTIKDCAVKNADIVADRESGIVVGYAGSMCVIENTTYDATSSATWSGNTAVKNDPNTVVNGEVGVDNRP